MSVVNKSINFVGELTLKTKNRYNFLLSKDYENFAVFPFNELKKTDDSYDGMIVFDYEKDSIIDYYKGKFWYVKYSNSDSTSSATFAVADSLEKELKVLVLYRGMVIRYQKRLIWE